MMKINKKMLCFSVILTLAVQMFVPVSHAETKAVPVYSESVKAKLNVSESFNSSDKNTWGTKISSVYGPEGIAYDAELGALKFAPGSGLYLTYGMDKIDGYIDYGFMYDYDKSSGLLASTNIAAMLPASKLQAGKIMVNGGPQVGYTYGTWVEYRNMYKYNSSTNTFDIQIYQKVDGRYSPVGSPQNIPYNSYGEWAVGGQIGCNSYGKNEVLYITKAQVVYLNSGYDSVFPQVVSTSGLDTELKINVNIDLDASTVTEENLSIPEGTVTNVSYAGKVITIEGENLVSAGLTRNILSVDGMPYTNTTVIVNEAGDINFMDAEISCTFNKALNNAEIDLLKSTKLVSVGDGKEAQITPIYNKNTNTLTVKCGELEPIMYSVADKTTKQAEYKLVLPEGSFENSDTTFKVTGSKLFEYLTVGEDFAESTGVTVTDAETTFEFCDDSENNRGYINSIGDFVIYGLKSTMSVNFYMDICVNTKDVSEDNPFKIRAANCNGKSSWITILEQKQGGIWSNNIEPYADEDGWSEFRICMQKDSAGNYLKSIYNKDKNGVYRLVASPASVYCTIDRQSQKVNRISWLTIGGGAGVKINNLKIYKDNPKNLTPKIDSVIYNGDGADVVFSRHMKKESVTNENIMVYNTSGEVIENADFNYDDSTKTLSITNSEVIDRISYGNNVIAVNGMAIEANTESHSCVISELAIVDEGGELITSLAGANKAYAVLKIENYNSFYADKQKTVVIAAYDGNGRLVATDFDTKELSMGVTNYSAEISFGENVTKLKAFLWDGTFDEIKPSGNPAVTVPGTQSVSIESVNGVYDTVIMKPGSNTAYVRGLRKQFSAPFLSGNSIMADIEDIAEITLSPVETDGDTKTVYYTDKEITFTSGSGVMKVVDRADRTENNITMSASVVIDNGIMYVPINDYLDIIGMNLNPYINDYIVFGNGELITRSFSSLEITVLESLFGNSINNGVDTTFYVDALGAEGNNGSEDAPFKTIEEAVEAVRSYKEANGMTGDIEVLIKNGTYYTDGIALSTEDSGENGYNIIYRAYPGHTPEIVSGEKVTDWELHEGNIYKAEITRDDFEVLIENDKLSHPARYPDSGYNKSAAMSGGALDNAFAFNKDDIPELKNEEKALVGIWPSGSDGNYSWRYDVMTISDIDYNSRIVYTANVASMEMGNNSRYFIENDYNLLSCEGEFYSDGEYLYYIPYANDINESEIIIANGADIFSLSGESYERRVKNIVFSGLTFMGADRDYSGIDMIYSSGITVDGCRFKNIGNDGVSVEKSYDVTVTNSEFKDIGNDGVVLKGSAISDKTISGFHKVQGNNFDGLGKINPDDASGVSVATVDNCYIAYNKISDCPRFGIDVSSNKVDIKQTNISYDEWGKYIRGQNTVVEGNDISDVCKDSMDGGAIYMWCAGTGNVIRGNRLHHSTSPISYWFPIYLDDGTDGTVIYNNVVDNNQNYQSDGYINGLFFFKGVENIMFNNIAVNNQHFTGASKDYPTFTTHSMANFENDRVKNIGNIFYNCGDKFVRVRKSGNSGVYYTPMTTRIAEQDYNMHYNDSGKYNPDIEMAESIYIFNRSGWLRWQNKKYDQHTLFGVNPNFVDVKNEDFRLKPDSRAYELGFSDIDFGSIGLAKGYPFADSSDKLDKIYIITSNKNNSIEKMTVGDNVSLNVTGRTENGFFIDRSNADVSFTSSDDSVAVVDRNGKVTALSTGTAKVTATIEYNGVTKNIGIDISVN